MSDHRDVLHNQRIDEHGPGTILSDFDSILEFIGSEGIDVSGRLHFFPMKLLAQLNARLTHPVEIALKRPQQKSYPHLHGLYLLVRASGLSRVVTVSKTRRRLILDEEVLASWRRLNPTERYCILLESWLLRGRSEILGEHGLDLKFVRCVDFFKSIPAKGLKIAGDRREEEMLNYYPELHQLALMQLFGFVSLKQCRPKPGGGWCIEWVNRTVFGEAILEYLVEFFHDSFHILDIDDPIETIGQLQPALQPFFPEWQRNLTFPETTFRDGLYVFKVSLGNSWRRIALPASLSLEMLAYAILDAFDFDYDHLFRFICGTRFGYPQHYNHSHMEEPSIAREVAVGQLGLESNDRIEFNYDFGDDWWFEVMLERIDPVDKNVKKAKVLESRGEAPEQYPVFDDDEF